MNTAIMLLSTENKKLIAILISLLPMKKSSNLLLHWNCHRSIDAFFCVIVQLKRNASDCVRSGSADAYTSVANLCYFIA